MMFSSVESYKIKSSLIFLNLTITEKISGHVYAKKYYKVKYHNGQELIFMTTNEPDTDYSGRILDDEYTLIIGFDHMVDEIEKSCILNHFIDSWFNTPPKYIYYDISVIHKELKPLFLNHLVKNISDYTSNDFDEIEKERLKKWFKYLTK
jgi:hypothetical protein